MEPAHHVTRILHDEHVAALGMLDRLAGLLAQAGHETPPAADAPGVSATLPPQPISDRFPQTEFGTFLKKSRPCHHRNYSALRETFLAQTSK